MEASGCRSCSTIRRIRNRRAHEDRPGDRRLDAAPVSARRHEREPAQDADTRLVERRVAEPDTTSAFGGIIAFNRPLDAATVQAIIERQFVEVIIAPVVQADALAGRLHEVEARWNPRAALGVVLTAGGHPDEPRLGEPIAGLERAAMLPGKVIHAGTRLGGGRVRTAGGRVLCAAGLGASPRHNAPPMPWSTACAGTTCSSAVI